MSHQISKQETEKDSNSDSVNILYSTKAYQKISPNDITSTFENILPPHSDEEKNILEANIVRDGEIRNSLIIWKDGNKNILVDGLLRHQIAIKFKLDCPVVYKDFKSIEEVKAFVFSEQLGRRNLSDFCRCELALQWANIITPLGRKNQSMGGKGCQIKDKDRIDTKKILARKAGVSHNTLAKVKKISNEVEDPKVIDDLRKGDRSISSAYNELTGKISKPEPLQHKFFDSFGELISEWSTLKSMTITPNKDGSFIIDVLTTENKKQTYETTNQIVVKEIKPATLTSDTRLLHILYDDYDFNTISNLEWEDIRTMFIQDIRKIYKYVSLNMSEDSTFRVFTEKLRLELLKNWEEKNLPLGGGRKTEMKIIHELKKFKDLDALSIRMTDDSGSHDVLNTGSKLTSGINQFFPEMLNTPTQSGKSPMDVIKDPISFLKFMERVIVNDGLHLFTKSLDYKSNKQKKAA